MDTIEAVEKLVQDSKIVTLGLDTEFEQNRTPFTDCSSKENELMSFMSRIYLSLICKYEITKPPLKIPKMQITKTTAERLLSLTEFLETKYSLKTNMLCLVILVLIVSSKEPFLVSFSAVLLKSNLNLERMLLFANMPNYLTKVCSLFLLNAIDKSFYKNTYSFAFVVNFQKTGLQCIGISNLINHNYEELISLLAVKLFLRVGSINKDLLGNNFLQNLTEKYDALVKQLPKIKDKASIFRLLKSFFILTVKARCRESPLRNRVLKADLEMTKIVFSSSLYKGPIIPGMVFVDSLNMYQYFCKCQYLDQLLRSNFSASPNGLLVSALNDLLIVCLEHTIGNADLDLTKARLESLEPTQSAKCIEVLTKTLKLSLIIIDKTQLPLDVYFNQLLWKLLYILGKTFDNENILMEYLIKAIEFHIRFEDIRGRLFSFECMCLFEFMVSCCSEYGVRDIRFSSRAINVLCSFMKHNKILLPRFFCENKDVLENLLSYVESINHFDRKNESWLKLITKLMSESSLRNMFDAFYPKLLIKIAKLILSTELDLLSVFLNMLTCLKFDIEKLVLICKCPCSETPQDEIHSLLYVSEKEKDLGFISILPLLMHIIMLENSQYFSTSMSKANSRILKELKKKGMSIFRSIYQYRIESAQTFILESHTHSLDLHYTKTISLIIFFDLLHNTEISSIIKCIVLEKTNLNRVAQELLLFDAVTPILKIQDTNILNELDKKVEFLEKLSWLNHLYKPMLNLMHYYDAYSKTEDAITAKYLYKCCITCLLVARVSKDVNGIFGMLSRTWKHVKVSQSNLSKLIKIRFLKKINTRHKINTFLDELESKVNSPRISSTNQNSMLLLLSDGNTKTIPQANFKELFPCFVNVSCDELNHCKKECIFEIDVDTPQFEAMQNWKNIRSIDPIDVIKILHISDMYLNHTLSSLCAKTLMDFFLTYDLSCAGNTLSYYSTILLQFVNILGDVPDYIEISKELFNLYYIVADLEFGSFSFEDLNNLINL